MSLKGKVTKSNCMCSQSLSEAFDWGNHFRMISWKTQSSKSVIPEKKGNAGVGWKTRSADCGMWKMRVVENSGCGKCWVWKRRSVENVENSNFNMTLTNNLIPLYSHWTSILYYYSFKIFPRFWLVETTSIIHHNQHLFTKFGKKLRHIESMTSKVQPDAGYWTNGSF